MYIYYAQKSLLEHEISMQITISELKEISIKNFDMVTVRQKMPKVK